MIITKDSEVEVKSNLSGEKIAMKVDPNALQHLADLVINLYEDTEMAVLREYSVNARDSHIAAGQTKPIEVWLPGGLNNILRIKDYGTGMDAQDIRTIYSLYGASTKRETNEQTGALGVGCKSALAYTSQFTLKGVKDGTYIVVSIGRDEDNVGFMMIVDEGETDEPNGVEISVPVRKDNRFASKAGELFKYWPEGSVLVNGKPPERFEGQKITDNIYISDHRYVGYGYRDREDIIVMGCVPYKTNLRNYIEDWPSKLNARYSIVAFVDIGDVHHAPNRERLRDTGLTKRRLARIEQEFFAGIQGLVEDEVEGAPTAYRALMGFYKWRDIIPESTLGKMNVHYKGKPIPTTVEAPKDKHLLLTNYYDKPMRNVEKNPSLPTSFLLKTLVVNNFDILPGQFTANHKKKLNKYTDENLGDKIRTYLLNDGSFNELEWLEDKYIVDWSDIKAIKLPVHNRGGIKTIQGSYDVYDPKVQTGKYWHFGETKASDIDTGRPIIYFDTSLVEPFRRTEVANYLKEHVKDAIFVEVWGNRLNKFCRLFPTARPYSDHVKEIQAKALKSITQEQINAYHLKRYEFSYLDELDYTKVKDPVLIKLIKQRKMEAGPGFKELNKIYKATRIHWPTLKEDFDEKYVRKTYPLLSDIRINKTNRDHLYLYLNAVNAQKEEENASE